MKIPLFNGPNEVGFEELDCDSCCDPSVLIYNRQKQGTSRRKWGSSRLHKALKGIYILLRTETEDDSFCVFVGHGGVRGKKANLFSGGYARLYRVLYKDKGMPDAISKWDKAILISDWEEDIKARAEQSGDYDRKTIERLVDEVMNSEVIYLKALLRSKLHAHNDLHLTSKSIGKNYFMPNPDLRRYKCYVAIAIELVEKIINGNIKIP